MSRLYTDQQMQAIVARLEAGGITIASACTAEGVDRRAFGRWCKPRGLTWPTSTDRGLRRRLHEAERHGVSLPQVQPPKPQAQIRAFFVPTSGRVWLPTCLGTAAEAIGTLEQGARILGLSKGQFSILDLVRAVLDQTGPAELVLSTWTIGLAEIAVLRKLLEAGTLTGAQVLIDRSFPSRQPEYAAALVEALGAESVIASRVHAKIAVVRNAEWSVSLHGSGNANRNRLFEQFALETAPEIAAFLLSQVEEIAAAGSEGFGASTAEIDEAMDEVWGGTAASQPRESRGERQLPDLAQLSVEDFLVWSLTEYRAGLAQGHPGTIAHIQAVKAAGETHEKLMASRSGDRSDRARDARIARFETRAALAGL